MIKKLTQKFEDKMQGNGIINFNQTDKTGEIEAIDYIGGKTALEFMNENGLQQTSGKCHEEETCDGESYLVYTYTFNF